MGAGGCVGSATKAQFSIFKVAVVVKPHNNYKSII